MAESGELVCIEHTETREDEEEWIKKAKEHFGEQLDIVPKIDLLRIIRGYAAEKEREKETFDHIQLFLNILKDEGFANVGFKPMKNDEGFKKMQEWGQMTVFGQDKFGHCVMYEDVASYQCDKIQENLPIALEFRRRMWCQMWNKQHEVAKKKNEVVYKHINVFNMDGIGVWGANTYKKVIQKMIQAEGDLFPETVYKMYFINCGWTFRAAWAVVKMFVHPVTQKKIKIMGGKSEYLPELQKDVDLKQIPKKYGGQSPKEITWGETTFDEPAKPQFPAKQESVLNEGIVEKAEETQKNED